MGSSASPTGRSLGERPAWRWAARRRRLRRAGQSRSVATRLGARGPSSALGAAQLGDDQRDCPRRPARSRHAPRRARDAPAHQSLGQVRVWRRRFRERSPRAQARRQARRVRAGERRGGAGRGPLAGLPPVGGGLVGQLGHRPLDALRVAGRRSRPSSGSSGRAVGDPHVRPGVGRLAPLRRILAGALDVERARRARRTGSRGRRRRRGRAGPSRRASGRPRGRSASTSRRR